MRDGRLNANLPSALVPSEAICTKSAEIVLILLNHASARITSSLAIDGIVTSMIGKLTRNIAINPKAVIRSLIIISVMIHDGRFFGSKVIGITGHHFHYRLAGHRVCQHDSPLK